MATPSLFIHIPGPKGIEYIEIMPDGESFSVGNMEARFGGTLFEALMSFDGSWTWGDFRVIVPKDPDNKNLATPLEGSTFLMTVDVVVDGGKIFPMEIFTGTIPYVSHKAPARRNVELSL